jgi:predicted alpha/beta superfamily hydrolase
MRLICVLLALTLVLSGERAVGQPAAHTPAFSQLPALRGGYFQLASKETGRTYHIYVRLPEGYDTNRAARYPVVYVLDGDSLFPILAASHLLLSIDDKLPEAIVVGIAYGGFDPEVNKRRIDFMPPGDSTSISGAAQFQQFLKSELFPVVETRYRADPARRILFGQSRGGAFVLYSAFTEPDMFWGRIANNPALPPTRAFFDGAPASATRSDLTLVVANGTDDWPNLRAETQSWLAARKKRARDPWALKDITIPNGTHAANSADAYRVAMRILFAKQP